VKDGEYVPQVTLKRVYYAPKMAFTLVSVACLDKAGCSLTIEDGQCIIRSPRPYRTILGFVPRVNNLYYLDSSAIQTPKLPKHYASVASGPISINELHRCIGHVNFQTLGKWFVRVPSKVWNWIPLQRPHSAKLACEGKPTGKLFPKLARLLLEYSS